MRSVGGTRDVRRLLVFLPNWLGDVVMTTPLLADLHAITPDPASNFSVELHVAVRPAWAPLFRDDPRLAGVHEVLRSGRHGGLTGIPRLAGAWRALALMVLMKSPEPSLCARAPFWRPVHGMSR